MVARHGAAALSRWRHHPTDIEALAIPIVRRIAEHTLHEKVAVFDELAHLGLGVTLGKDDDVDSLGDVFVANPCLIDRQVKLVVVANEIVRGADAKAHSFLEFALPGLVT